MAEQHRATDKQWDLIGRMRHHGGHPEFSAILELLHRIEALEAAAKPHHPAKPDSSLVKRVAVSLAQPGSRTWDEMSAAAIREVAAWLWEQERYVLDWAAVTLEEEAKHRST